MPLHTDACGTLSKGAVMLSLKKHGEEYELGCILAMFQAPFYTNERPVYEATKRSVP